MSFSAEWLALRGPADDAARDPGLVRRAQAWLAQRPGAKALDLGCGAGAILGAVGGPEGAVWRLVDEDAALLALAGARAAALGVRAQVRKIDLASGLAAAFQPAPALVTASAFFDLAGAAWIDAFADAAVDAGCAVYAPLIYDGREAWSPAHPDDAVALARLHADMRRDKGLGPALGPDAAPALAQALTARGFAVATAPSPWRLRAAENAALIAALAAGTAEAAQTSAAWRFARAEAERVEIGHVDLWAEPLGRASGRRGLAAAAAPRQGPLT